MESSLPYQVAKLSLLESEKFLHPRDSKARFESQGPWVGFSWESTLRDWPNLSSCADS